MKPAALPSLPPLLLTALVAVQPLAPALAAVGAPAAQAEGSASWGLVSASTDEQQEKKKKKQKQEQKRQEQEQQLREERQKGRQQEQRREQERQQQEREMRDKYKDKYDQKYQNQLDRDRREQQQEKEMKQHYKDKYEDKYRSKYRRNMERSRYAPGYRHGNRRYDWDGWDRNRWANYNRYPSWNPWTRPVAYGGYNAFPMWAQPGWYNVRPWDTGWYGGWSSPPWGWWGGQSIAWGLASLATTALINSLVDQAVQQRQPAIMVPQSSWRLIYGTVEPQDIGNVSFVASNGAGSYRLTADCNEGLLDGQVPYQAAQAQLLNAACQVAYGTYASTGYNPAPYRPTYGGGTYNY